MGCAVFHSTQAMKAKHPVATPIAIPSGRAEAPASASQSCEPAKPAATITQFAAQRMAAHAGEKPAG